MNKFKSQLTHALNHWDEFHCLAMIEEYNRSNGTTYQLQRRVVKIVLERNFPHINPENHES